MVKRLVVLLAALTPAVPALAGEMSAEEARRFVVGKTFNYSCFEGTRGAGRIYADGSVAGTIQMQGKGPMRYVSMPAGTLQVKGESVCASVRGMFFQPCFNLEKVDERTFRGSVSGLGFARCEFTRGGSRMEVAEAGARPPTAARAMRRPRPVQSTATVSAAPVEAVTTGALRGTMDDSGR
jgi:hypothetical protein